MGEDLQRIARPEGARPNRSIKNYIYDSIGNLVKDSIEHISLIKWNVYGKITEIDHSTTSLAKPTKNIYYYYDASGNRIGKKTTSGDSSTVSYTWYVRDASGNVMATYTAGIDSSSALSTADLHVGEKDIYGSSRLGLLNANYSVDAAGDGFSAYTSPWTGIVLPYYTGRKQYELTNHLGNVLATISDKKIGVSLSTDSSLIDHCEADVQTAQDYYPFGMIMPGRMFTSLSIPGGSIDSGTSQVNGYTLPVDLTLTSRTSDMPSQYVATQVIDLDQGFSSGDSTDVFTAYIADTTYAGTGNGGSDPNGVAGQGKYRYGFNGKENDNEVKGIGDQIDYGERIYDPRVARFMSVDPLARKFVMLTPYQFASNTPIGSIDIEGKEAGIPLNGIGLSGTPMSNYFDNAAGRKLWLKTMGTGLALGGAVLTDVYLTKGRLTQTLIASTAIGAIQHNKASTKEGRTLQDQTAKANLTQAFLMWGGGEILGLAPKVFSNLKEVKVPFNPDAAVATEASLFRGDTRSPEQIFKSGFESKGTSNDIVEYVEVNAQSKFIGTSKNANEAAQKVNGKGYIYVVSNNGQGLDVNNYYKAFEGIDNPRAKESEVIFENNIPTNQIEGAFPVINGKIDIKGFIANPYYKAPQTTAK